MSMEPDIVLMESESWRRKVPVTLWDMWLMTVERDMMNWRLFGRLLVDGVLFYSFDESYIALWGAR